MPCRRRRRYKPCHRGCLWSPVSEVREGLPRPSFRSELEHYSATVLCTPSTCLAEDAVAISRAIEVAFGVQCQRCARDSPVRLSREVVQHSLRVSRVHFEHHSVVRSSAIYGSAIEVASRVADQTCIGERTVRWISCKAVQ